LVPADGTPLAFRARQVTAITSMTFCPPDNRVNLRDTKMTGSIATLPFAFARPARAGLRGFQAWRHARTRPQDARAHADPGAPPAAARTPDVGSAWTPEEQRFLRALREAGL
jgi:hypothetical protein